MGTIRLNMDKKEIAEGYRAGIPEPIMAKMIQGMELNEREKEFVRSRGKAYVLGHTKERGTIKIKPQLRDLPGGEKQVSELFKLPRLTVEEELEETYGGYYDDELEGDVLEATNELEDLEIFTDRDVELLNSNSDIITVLINYLKEKEEEEE